MSHASTYFVFSLVLLLAIACDDGATAGKASTETAQPKTHAEGVKVAAAAYDALDAIAKGFPEMTSLEPKPCSAPLKYGQWGGIGWITLMEITGNKVLPAEREVSGVDYQANIGALPKLPPRAKGPFHSASAYTSAAKDMTLRSHLAVLRLEVGKAPKAEDGSARFQAGIATGYLVMFELGSQKPVCWWPVKAESSNKITYSVDVTKDEKNKESAKRYAINQDLKKRMKDALWAAEKKMIPGL